MIKGKIPRWGAGRGLRGAAIFHDVPVRVLHCDALVHRDVFPGGAPKLVAYNPGARGPANPNDPARDIDSVHVGEPIAELGYGIGEGIDAPGVANYAKMLGRVFKEIGEDPVAYRTYRVRIAYPLHGFQYVLAFAAPVGEGGS